MKFSNRTEEDFQPFMEQQAHQSVTQSQIINTLNSSIEDLMSKILQVRNQYQNSTQEPFKITHDINTSPSSPTQPNFNLQSQDFSRRIPVKNTKKLNASFPKKVSQDNLNDQNRFSKFSVKNKSFNVQNTSNRNHSLQEIRNQQQNQQNPTIVNKIQSLFNNSVIKQVAESTIFGQSEPFQGCGALELNTRQVSEIIVEDSFSISDFEVGREVGSGKFGQVYLCRHRSTGCIFALKKIFKSTIKQYNMQSQFCLQLKILYMLNHPNIIKLYAHFADQYHVFLLMEYVEGGQLLAKLKSQQKYVSRVIEQVINAVDYIHNRGIVHRDIKPENIVMAFDDTAKLCDFGWAGLFDFRNMKTTFCGTLDYVSPEMKDLGVYTSKVDLWSIGVLTYELLTGSAPFKQEIDEWKRKGSKRSISWDWNIRYPLESSGLSQSFMRNLLKENPDERASLRFCKNHYFIRKYKEDESEINIQIYI